MEIGLFQLENLIVARNPFRLLDLREHPVSHPELGDLLKSAETVDPRNVFVHLNKSATDKNFPLVLLCQNGQTSTHIASQLEAQGYKNIYIVERGTEGLLSEL